jgi:hypothetical protein
MIDVRPKMTLLYTLFGAFLALAVYGPSFIPTATLDQGDDFEDVIDPAPKDF